MNRIKKHIVYLFLILFYANCFAQNKISADVTVQQLFNNKLLTLHKSIFYTKDGKCVTRNIEPEEVITISNHLGEYFAYNTQRNELIYDVDQGYSTKSEPLDMFASAERSDLGLSSLGFSLQGQEIEGKRVVKTFIPKEVEKISKITMVYENDLPIYCGYFNKKGEEFRQIYYTEYFYFPFFAFPTKITEISFSEKKEKTIRRMTYSNILYDENATSEYFNYQIPSDAKVVKMDIPKK